MNLIEFDGLSSRLDIIKSFSDMSDPEEINALVRTLRPRLRNVIGATIGKGGEGKTTITTNLAYVLAEAENERVRQGKPSKPILYIELDSNGNGRLNLGIRGGEFDDDGLGFFEALTEDKEFKVVQGVRPHLDMVVSGSHNADIPSSVTKLSDKHGIASYLLLAVLLAQISHRYRWILLDFSPGDKMIQRLGLAACTHLVAPMKGSDNAVIEGLGTLATLVRQIRRLNDEVAIVSLIFLGYRRVNDQPTSQLTNLREKMGILLDRAHISREVLVDAFIRDGATTANLARNYGMPAGEFALAAAGQLFNSHTGDRVDRPRDENGRYADPQRAFDLAADYTNVATQVIQLIRQRNQKLQGAEAA
ncbi:ParA family protein [Streptomyces sp. AK02-04a]|uniref:ParA family protein n=1 Tax=Streptomyces sp. AK02-04a TaxID=3028649 RepID=UPI0029ABBC85|nr:ParA family protein [Streptomyces sp. AK02-04a]MDX3762794.1 ParA family protein [Streptomyces sp. AK02-04a]